MEKYPKIEMESICKNFDTIDTTTLALRNVNMKIFSGEFATVTGPSGCGKSTLLSIMGLLDRADSGSYKLDGIDVSRLSIDEAAGIRNEKIGFIFQSFNLIDDLSVYENVVLPLRYSSRQYSSKEMASRVSECLELVKMSHRVNHKPNQLSGGQQQRIAIARALIARPSILLVDEPTGNLDSESGDAIINTLLELHREGNTICMVTHDPRYAKLTEKQIFLCDGEIVSS